MNTDKCGACVTGILADKEVYNRPGLYECLICGTFNRVPRRKKEDLIVPVGPCEPDVFEVRISAEKNADDLRTLLRMFEAHNQRKANTLFDICSGIGGIVWLAKMFGLNASGNEVRPEAIEAAKRVYNIDLHNRHFEDVLFTHELDIITCFHGIEHTLDPYKTMVVMEGQLAVGGLVWLAHPCIPKGLAPQYTDMSAGVGGHNYEWTYEAFEKFLKQFDRLELVQSDAGGDRNPHSNVPPTQQWWLRKR